VFKVMRPYAAYFAEDMDVLARMAALP